MAPAPQIMAPAPQKMAPVPLNLSVWKKVAAQMQAKGYYFGAEACDNKFRQLKQVCFDTGICII